MIWRVLLVVAFVITSGGAILATWDGRPLSAVATAALVTWAAIGCLSVLRETVDSPGRRRRE